MPINANMPINYKGFHLAYIYYSDFKAKCSLSRKTWDAVQGLISHHIVANSEILMVAIEKFDTVQFYSLFPLCS